jgi:hypothetical protein
VGGVDGYFHMKTGLKILIYSHNIIMSNMFILVKIFMKYIINLFINRSEYISCHHRL